MQRCLWVIGSIESIVQMPFTKTSLSCKRANNGQHDLRKDISTKVHPRKSQCKLIAQETEVEFEASKKSSSRPPNKDPACEKNDLE